jgi:AraC-like DNA-binding protein
LSQAGDGFDVRSLALTYRCGARIHEHGHPWGQLVYASAGVMRLETATQHWVVPPTRAIWLPAGLMHSISSSGGLSLRTLYIDGSRGAILPAQPTAFEVAPLLRELILHILAIGMLAPDRPEHDRLAGLLIDLLLAAKQLDLSLPLPRDPRALRLAALLRQEGEDGRDLAELARMTGASLRTLQRLFPHETGFTIEAWRQKARLIDAVAHLSEGASVTQAALDCGYQSLGAFIAAFSRQFGMTPGRFAREAAH